MGKSFATIQNDVQLLAAGMTSHLEELASIGIAQGTIDSLQAIMQVVVDNNNNQERLKAELKTATQKYDESFDALYKEFSAARKRVKLAIPQSMWKKFGILDKL